MLIGFSLERALSKVGNRDFFVRQEIYDYDVKKFTTSKNPAQFIVDGANRFADKIMAMPYADAYWLLKNDGMNMDKFIVPKTADNTPIEKRLFDSEGKRTRFKNNAEVTALVTKTEKYSKWLPSEVLPFAYSLYDPFSYRKTYYNLFYAGVDLSGYVHPDLVESLTFDVSTPQPVVVDDDGVDLGLFFVLLFGLLALYRFSNV